MGRSLPIGLHIQVFFTRSWTLHVSQCPLCMRIAIWLMHYPSMYILELNLSLKRRPDGLKRSGISRFGSFGEEREEQEIDMILLVALEPKLEPFWWKTILLLEASSTDWLTTVRHYHFRTIKPTKCYAKVSRKVGYKVQKAQREYAKYTERS